MLHIKKQGHLEQLLPPKLASNFRQELSLIFDTLAAACTFV